MNGYTGSPQSFGVDATRCQANDGMVYALKGCEAEPIQNGFCAATTKARRHMENAQVRAAQNRDTNEPIFTSEAKLCTAYAIYAGDPESGRKASPRPAAIARLVLARILAAAVYGKRSH